jgi:hypothetical protein
VKYAPRTRIIEAREAALDPEDLPGFFVARANAGDVEGLVALYEPDTVLTGPEGSDTGRDRGDPQLLRRIARRPAPVRA